MIDNAIDIIGYEIFLTEQECAELEACDNKDYVAGFLLGRKRAIFRSNKKAKVDEPI